MTQADAEARFHVGQVATDKAAGKPSSAIADWIRLTRLMECRDSSQAQPPKHGMPSLVNTHYND